VLLSDGKELRREGEYRIAVDEGMLQSPADLPALGAGVTERSATPDVDALAIYLRRLPQPVEVTDRPGFISTRR
jgi:hypothetical protein